MSATFVSLSSGDSFYVDAEPRDVAAFLTQPGLVAFGGRFVATGQVSQLVPVPYVPSIHTAEILEEAEHGPTGD